METVNKEKEEEIMYEFEELLYCLFKIYQNPNKYCMRVNPDRYGRKLNKFIENFDQYYFMSKRFYMLYQILLKKYPELEFHKKIYQPGEIVPNGRTLYINDCNSEIPKGIEFYRRSNERMMLVMYANKYFEGWYIPNFETVKTIRSHMDCNSNVPWHFYKGDLENSNIHICDKRIEIDAPWSHTDEEISIIDENCIPDWGLRQIIMLYYRVTIRRLLDYLGCELRFLENNGVSNVWELASLRERKYFEVVFKNEEQIRYFLQNYYKLRWKYADRKMNWDFWQKTALEMTKDKFGEKLNSELMNFLGAIEPNFHSFLHFPLDYNNENISNILDSIGRYGDDLPGDDFYEKSDLIRKKN